MIISTSKIKNYKLLRGRTLDFETLNKREGNLILIPTVNAADIVSVINSHLFRPAQLFSVFIPRLIRLHGKSPVRVDQKAYYQEIKKSTRGKIRIGKVLLDSYNRKNLIYDMTREYTATLEHQAKLKGNIATLKYMSEYFENRIEELSSDADYPDTYLIFPLDNYISDFRKKVIGNLVPETEIEPIITFLRSVKKGNISEKYRNVKAVFFFNSKADILLKLDLKDEDLENNFMVAFQKIIRLNNFNNGEDDLVDLGEDEDPLDDADAATNAREQIKDILLRRIAKEIGAKGLVDFDAATKEERSLILAIDQKIDAYLDQEGNSSKPFAELVDAVETDTDLKMRAIQYLQTKKTADLRSEQMSKNLDKEVEVLGRIADLDAEDKIVAAEEIEVDIPYFDERVRQSTLIAMDRAYNEKQSKKDLINIISAFSSNEKTPFTITSLDIEDTSDDFNEKETVKVRYRTDEGKDLSFQLDIPKIVDERYFFLGGNKKVMNRQFVRLPIVKTKTDRVEITTCFNKMTIERSSGRLSRKNAYVEKILKESYGKPGLKVVYGTNGALNSKFQNDFEFEELAQTVSLIETPKYEINFNRQEMQDIVDTLDIPENFCTKERTLIGFEKRMDERHSLLYIENSKVYTIEIGTYKIHENGGGLFELILRDILKTDLSKLPTIGKSFVYSKIKFLRTTYPLIVLTGLSTGLSDILRRYKVEYHISEKKLRPDGQHVEVKFKDCYLYYKDTIANSILLSPLENILNSPEYRLVDFDTEKPYNDYFIAALGPTVGSHAKNTLPFNMGVMIDPITRDVLKDLGKSTNLVDLLLEANTMLTTSAYRPQNDMRNFRLRGTESMYAMMYKILAEAYVQYQKHRLNGRPMSLDIPRNKLVSQFMTSNIVGEYSFLNPALEAEGISWATAKGPNGINLMDAFTLEVRAYDGSMVGLVSGNSTPPTGSVGVVRSLTYNPKIDSVRGYIRNHEDEQLSAANVLGIVELLNPFTAASADPPRQAMTVTQTKHVMPTLKTSRQLIGTGINKTLPFILSDTFCFKAKKDGKVESINEAEELAILAYDDGTKDAIDLGATFFKNSNSGFYIEQKYLFAYKVGERFKARDVIAYNPSYFSGKGKNVDYRQGCLAKVAIAAGDFAFEDSTIISDKLSKKCISSVVMEKALSLGPHAIIHNIVKVGDKVSTGDHLIDFTRSFQDAATSEFLQNLAGSEAFDELSQEAIKSKYTGEVVDIRIYYNKPLEELSPSLQELIKNYSAAVERRRHVLRDVKTSSVHIPPVQEVKASKIRKTEFEREGGVIIEFLVKYDTEMREGDKLTLAVALKGVISNVLDEDESPLSEHRPEEVVEAILTPTGVIGRMTSDIYLTLWANKVLIETGKQIREIWEGKR